MPEMPEMQALSERLDRELAGAVLRRADVLGFTGLKTVVPSPEELGGRKVTGVARRGKFVVLSFEGGLRLLLHLSQAGRVDIERPPKSTKPRGAVVRLVFDVSGVAADGDDGDRPGGAHAGEAAVLVREHGTQRKAGWWVLAKGDDGPLEALGVEAGSDDLDTFLLEGDSSRRLHTLLRDQRVVAGIGRGWADDILNRAGLSPFASLRSLTPEQRQTLVGAVHAVLDEALELERRREGGLSEAKLGYRFSVHNRAGQPCPRCGSELHRVSYDSYEVAYCPHCQTHGKVLADRRMSRLLR
jgi:formamidopyrimidine-DNA glycosylase